LKIMPMGPPLEAVTPNPRLPGRVDVVVIGGGIVGCATALELAERGIAVALCEKGEIAAEQSSRNWGWVRKMKRDPRELPLIIESLRLWNGLDARIGAETGFRRTGILYACDTEEKLEGYRGWLDYARPYQLDTRLLNAAETAALLPGGNQAFQGGLYTASDGRAEPQRATTAIARAAQARGAALFTACAVRSVETAAGRVSGVVTEKGPIACSAVVLAGGAWSSLFCGNLGIRLPQLKVQNSVLRTEPLEGDLPACNVSTGSYAFRKRLDGGYSVADGRANRVDIVPDSFRNLGVFLPALKAEWRSLQLRFGARFFAELGWKRRWSADERTPFEQVRTLDPAPDAAASEAALRRAAADFPAFAKAKVAQHWAGLIDVTPDAVPVISPVAALPGLVIATGFSGHGFGIGPGAGKLAADLVTNATPIVDPKDFRFSRFGDGTKMVVIAGF
jgi:glycine/D-amino acid oxidase-like deaminating enzyme